MAELNPCEIKKAWSLNTIKIDKIKQAWLNQIHMRINEHGCIES